MVRLWPINTRKLSRKIVDDKAHRWGAAVSEYRQCDVCGAPRRVLLHALGQCLCNHCWEIHASTQSEVIEMRIVLAIQRDDADAVRSLRTMLTWAHAADLARRERGLITGDEDGPE
jgi:hypothetical protein